MQPKLRDVRTLYADTFKDRRVVDAYRHRPPYPDEVFAILASLLTDEPGTVLDVGAGSGDLARRMVESARRVDAVDFSESIVVEELETRGFFHKQREKETAPVAFFQSIEDFIEGLHSRSSFSRELIGQQQAADLEGQVRDLLLQFHPDGILPLQVVGTVIWGTPESGTAHG